MLTGALTMQIAGTFALFFMTAIAEIVGCYLPMLWLRKGGSPWLLLPTAIALSIFVWLLSLHPDDAGRVYAAYGGIYVGAALLWLLLVESVRPTATDLVGVALILAGSLVIIIGSRAS